MRDIENRKNTIDPKIQYIISQLKTMDPNFGEREKPTKTPNYEPPRFKYSPE